MPGIHSVFIQSFMKGRPLSQVAVVTALLFAPVYSRAAQSIRVNERSFEQSVRPLVKQYCVTCHSTAKHKGDIDLEEFSSLSAVLNHPEPWERVYEEISMDEMPPKEKPQPASEDRARLAAWVNNALEKAAQKRAGDPGPVVLRRLNNAEYTYTIRDLTGVESLDPAAEFPADSAAGEGFMNTGNTLVMSPTLITKYLDAGKAIASHAVLLPDGIRFSAKTTRRDWTDEILGRIRAFYDRFTEPGGADMVTQQGIALDRNKGGAIPLDKYFAASLELRDGAENIAIVAAERGLSAKYLGLLMNSLNSRQPSPLLDSLRAHWRAAKPGDVPALVAEIAKWQQALWKFNSVGHIGMAGGPKSWLEPVTPPNGISTNGMDVAYDEFREMFPAALCYTKIVPVDEVVTLTLFYREDDQLSRLMLDSAQKARLDRMWDELHFVSQDAITLVDAFEQLWQYSSQDGPDAPHGDRRLEPLREPINQRSAAFKQRLVDTQPRHLEAVLEFAEKAYRRPLTDDEKNELRGLYHKLRREEIPHDEAIRLLLARVFVAPAFLYRLENAPAGTKPSPISDWELANRLSYFLWSSAPDAELLALAANGKLHKPDVLATQTRRMLGDERVRRLATEFACEWLHIHDFQSLDEKSDRHFPTFASLRGPMYEEAIRFFTDSFQNDASVLALFDTDHTFLNDSLAKHYGIPGVTGAEWRRVDGVRKYGRGGILGLSATLAKESDASRTSPILRGDWVSEVLLGEKIPRPPKGVPQLPEDESTETLTVRQLTEKHISDPQCAGCHARFDGYGYALEGFDAIGRLRTADLGGRPIDTRTVLFDGTSVDGADDLRHYLLTKKRDAIVQQFCRKLLGYSLGRSVILSDRPLLAEMQEKLRKNGYGITAAVETIVHSKQFLEIRGHDTIVEE
jgi:hypothetical protein